MVDKYSCKLSFVLFILCIKLFIMNGTLVDLSVCIICILTNISDDGKIHFNFPIMNLHEKEVWLYNMYLSYGCVKNFRGFVFLNLSSFIPLKLLLITTHVVLVCSVEEAVPSAEGWAG